MQVQAGISIEHEPKHSVFTWYPKSTSTPLRKTSQQYITSLCPVFKDDCILKLMESNELLMS